MHELVGAFVLFFVPSNISLGKIFDSISYLGREQ